LLLITVERARRDHVTTLGYDRHTTGLLKLDQPSVLDIDTMGQNGVIFANAFAPSSDDRVSVASLLTGALPVSGGQLTADDPLRAQFSTLAEDFAARGFQTGAFLNGSSLGEVQCGPGGFGRGFERSGCYSTDEEMLTAAVAWMSDELRADTPVFLWVHLAGIQVPFAGEPLLDRLSKLDYLGPVRAEAAFFERLRASEFQLDADDRQRLRDLYDGRLLRVSQLINSFLFLYRNTFAEGTLWEHTVVVILGTSGCELAEHRSQVANRDSLIDAGLHVPLQFWHPGSLTGERILGAVVELPDVTASLRDWFRLESAEGGTGQSLLSLTDSNADREFEPRGAFALAHAGERVSGASLRTSRWRFVFEDGLTRLHDVEVDPGQHHDVAQTWPTVVEELRAQLAQRLGELGL
jgi:arylsulfatase A-like enzyme